MGMFDHIVARVNDIDAAKAAKRQAEEQAERERVNTLLRAELMNFLDRIGVTADTTHVRHRDAFAWVERDNRDREIVLKPHSDVISATVEGVEFIATMMSVTSGITPQVYATAECDLCGHRVWSRHLWGKEHGSSEYYREQADKEIAKVVRNPPHVWGVDVPSAGSDYTAMEREHAKVCGRVKWTLTDSRSGAKLHLNARTQEEAYQQGIARLGYTVIRETI